MKKTNDEEVLDKEKKPTTRKKATSKKSSTTSKANTKTSDGTVKKTTKKSSTTNSKTKKEATTKKTKKASSTSKNKKVESTENSKVKKTSTTRKKKDLSEKSNLEKVENEPVYINPDILKFEERLKNPKKPVIPAEEPDDEELLNLEPKEESTSNEKNSIKTDLPKNEKKSEEKSLKKQKTKKGKKFNINYVYNTVIAICIILIIYSSINIILWQKNNIDNSKLIQQVSEITPVTETSKVVINENLQIEKKSYDFTELLNQNPDTVGWIHLDNTDIDYPIVKSTDNDFYLTHAFDKSYNAAGWIYADYRNKCDDTDTNLIIYGHNRLNNNMFGTLENVLSNPWLADENNHYIHYSSINKSHIYNIFTAFICSSDESVNYLRTNFSSNSEFLQYINSLKDKSAYNFNINLTENDKIITLYTCHGLNNERLLVCGKLIN